ncbi:MAG: HIT family protein [Acidobacteriota bacterium]
MHPDSTFSRRSLLTGSLAALAAPRGLPGTPAVTAAPGSDPDCVFCQIVAGKREATFVWKDDLCVVFASINPLQPGHLLVVPRQHVENVYGLPEDVGAHILPVASRVGRAMKVTLGLDGLTLLQNNGKASGQAVFHFHLHLIPRHEGVEVFKTVVESPRATPEQLESAVAPIRKALGSGR